MNGDESLIAFEYGFPSSRLEKVQDQKTKRTRKKKSKLDAAEDEIKKWWVDGRSLGFIRDRLKNKGISCERSTVQRYLKKALSL